MTNPWRPEVRTALALQAVLVPKCPEIALQVLLCYDLQLATLGSGAGSEQLADPVSQLSGCGTLARLSLHICGIVSTGMWTPLSPQETGSL